VGVEPTGRRFPAAPQALKARRVTGPYSLPNRRESTSALGSIKLKEIMANKYEILKKRRVNRMKKKARLKRRAQEHFQARKGSSQS